MTEVYADILFLINFSMDYLCLYLVARIMRRKPPPWRLIIASVLGGIYSVLALVLSLGSIPSLLCDVGVCILMCALAFAEKRQGGKILITCSALYVGISMLTGGIMTALFNLLDRASLPLDGIGEDGISVWLFAILAAVSGFISMKTSNIISRRHGARSCLVRIEFEGKIAEFSGMVDSGNLVRDPLSSREVIIIDRKKGASLVDPDITQKYLSGEINSGISGRHVHLIPIRTASGEGVIVALFPKKATVILPPDKRGRVREYDTDALFALSDIGESAEDFDAIVPEAIIKN